jgi:hypothetical protein
LLRFIFSVALFLYFVMTGTLGDVGLGLIGHRLVTMGWDCRSMATKEKLHTGKGREQN